MKTRALVFGVALAATGASALGEELTIVSKLTKDGQPAGTATSYIGAGRVRMAQPDGSEIVVDGKAGQMTVLDGKKKQYYVMTREDLDAAAAQIEARMKEMQPQLQKMQEQMKSLPPEMQKKMQGMMGGAGLAAAINVERAGSKTVAGYACENWVISIGQISKTEQCMTTAITPPLEAWTAYRDLGDRMQASLASMGPAGQNIKELQAKFAAVQGLPLSTATTTSVMGRTSSSSNEVTEIRKGPIPESAWAIPPDYKKIASPLAKLAK